MQRSARSWSSEASRLVSTAWLLPETRRRVAFAPVQPAHWGSRGRASALRNLEPTRAEDLPWTICAGTRSLASKLSNYCLEQTRLAVLREDCAPTPA